MLEHLRSPSPPFRWSMKEVPFLLPSPKTTRGCSGCSEWFLISLFVSKPGLEKSTDQSMGACRSVLQPGCLRHLQTPGRGSHVCSSLPSFLFSPAWAGPYASQDPRRKVPQETESLPASEMCLQQRSSNIPLWALFHSLRNGFQVCRVPRDQK